MSNNNFHLTRTYSLKSFLGIAVVAAALVLFYYTIAEHNMTKQETNFNVSLTQSLSETIMPKYAAFIAGAHTIPVDQLTHAPEIVQLRNDIARKVRGLRVVKVKIYDTHALTVFSSDPKQIGELKNANEGYLRAMAGEPASEVVFKENFSTFEKQVEDINVVSSYIPARRSAGEPIEAVFEIYSDVTELHNDILRTGYIILAGVTSLLLLLYVFLFITIKQADKIIRQHEEETTRRQQERIHFLEHCDILTDLSNRSRFMEMLEAALNRSREAKTTLGIMSLSINRFKLINENVGRESGDKILIEAARRIKSCVPQHSHVARMGSDEFAIIAENYHSKEFMQQLAEKIIAAFSTPFHIAGREIIATLRIGIAITEQGGATSAEQIMENAIAAMRKAKDTGGNCVVFYSSNLNPKSRERLEIEQDLRKALAYNQYVLHYQPIVNTQTGQVAGAEALIRWQHPERGMVPPLQFINLLEELDLMIPVGTWVLEEACRQLSAWHKAGHTHLTISVNLSLRQFRSPSLLATVKQAITQSGIPKHCLKLELTESVLADDVNQAASTLHALQKLRVGISLDDFGTGYSSLSYLMHFPVKCLKVDRSFISNVTTNKQNAALVTAIIAMAKSLNLSTVAEGIETVEQFHFIKALGCTEAQGYWLSKPQPAAEIPKILDTISKTVNNEIARISLAG